eukprot:4326265-Pyramimonas_sp.AAC.1
MRTHGEAQVPAAAPAFAQGPLAGLPSVPRFFMTEETHAEYQVQSATSATSWMVVEDTAPAIDVEEGHDAQHVGGFAYQQAEYPEVPSSQQRAMYEQHQMQMSSRQQL